MTRAANWAVGTISVAGVLTIGAVSYAGAAEPVGPKLTPRLKELLATEMQQVSQATADLSVAIAAGERAHVKELGTKIRDSFILKQSLTDQDKQDLKGAVPAEFIALDRKFHGAAGKLAHAAEVGDDELVVFYYGRMVEACVTCHAHFAADRFSGFSSAAEGARPLTRCDAAWRRPHGDQRSTADLDGLVSICKMAARQLHSVLRQTLRVRAASHSSMGTHHGHATDPFAVTGNLLSAAAARRSAIQVRRGRCVRGRHHRFGRSDEIISRG